ncbi:SDR family NAD(P)-dependent oxidoreductase [Limosilactobacillus fermentum]
MGVHFENARGNSLYLASKAGLRRTSKILRNELAPFNIQVMVVEPGSFQTNFRVGGIVVSDQQSDLYRESYADAEVLR